MKIIGITGGIKAGKTEVLAYIRGKYNCQVLLADEAAHKVKEPGESCYGALVKLLGQEILAPDGRIDRQKMAEKIFGSEALLQQVNDLIHPVVREYILKEIEKAGQGRKNRFFVYRGGAFDRGRI